ncbi:MAG: ribosomal protein S18-alanine N-acetyltransferase, partial [Armatimonadetes bacterium]|nr:ribosomal protein S18-alanine N-acetyltransferase [Armatimonadota bacterium]
REILNDPKYLVLLQRDEKGDAVGYLIGWIVGDEAELARIGVLPEFRGRGDAKKLLDVALEVWRKRGAARVWLEVRESNAAALGLYQSRGFQIVGKRANYYENGEAALLMTHFL